MEVLNNAYHASSSYYRKKDMKDSDSMFIFNVYENEGELSQSSLTESPRPNPLIQLPKPLLCYTYINIA